jgi:hypothetical protein
MYYFSVRNIPRLLLNAVFILQQYVSETSQANRESSNWCKI